MATNNQHAPHVATADNAADTPNVRVAKIFVVGNSRSGTTMLARALGRHSDIFTFEELHFFEEQWQSDQAPLAHDAAVAMLAQLMAIQRHNYYFQGDPDDYVAEATAVVDSMDDRRLPSRVFAHWLATEARRAGADIACLQTPRNVYYLDEILALYPDAMIVNIVRDPRAVLLSQKGRWKGKWRGDRKIPLRHILRTWAGYHPVTMGLLWRGGVRAAEHHAAHERVLSVRFETLVAQPEAILAALCERCGVALQPAMLEVPRVNSSNRPNQMNAVGFDAAVAEKWREGGLNSAEIALCQRVAGAEMAQHGYVAEPTSINPVALLYFIAIWPVKLGLALLLNAGRMGNFAAALRRRLTGA